MLDASVAWPTLTLNVPSAKEEYAKPGVPSFCSFESKTLDSWAMLDSWASLTLDVSSFGAQPKRRNAEANNGNSLFFFIRFCSPS